MRKLTLLPWNAALITGSSLLCKSYNQISIPFYFECAQTPTSTKWFRIFVIVGHGFYQLQSINNNDLFIGEFMVSFSNIYFVCFLSAHAKETISFFLANFLDVKQNESDLKAIFTTPKILKIESWCQNWKKLDVFNNINYCRYNNDNRLSHPLLPI